MSSYDSWKLRSPDDERDRNNLDEPQSPREIVTSFWGKPISFKLFDWQATFADDEPDENGAMRVGYGSTRSEAIADLLANYEEDDQ